MARRPASGDVDGGSSSAPPPAVSAQPRISSATASTSPGDGGAASYILGGWCIGTVLDSGASRAAVRNQVRTAPSSMAMNVNVNVEWWTADELFRNYMDIPSGLKEDADVPDSGKGGSVRPRNDVAPSIIA